MKAQNSFMIYKVCSIISLFHRVLTFAFTVIILSTSAQSDISRIISFGTTLDPQAVMIESQKLAESISDPKSPQWQAKGDQQRTYHFKEANVDETYRICVPENWDGKSILPLVMFLHGGGSDESTYLDQNNKQMVHLANDHGYLLVSPMGDKGAYGNFLRLSAPFGNEKGAAELMAQVTPESELINQLSEKDVINVLELVLHEYPIDRTSMFLTGHSMGSGGTWYIGGKYSNYWKAFAPMSGPFVQKSGYPWDSLHQIQFFITEGIQTPSLNGSRALRDWMNEQGFNLKYKEVNADHGGMIPLVLPDVYDFFDNCRLTTSIKHSGSFKKQNEKHSARYRSSRFLKIRCPIKSISTNGLVLITDLQGRRLNHNISFINADKMRFNGELLPAGIYMLWTRSGLQK